MTNDELLAKIDERIKLDEEVLAGWPTSFTPPKDPFLSALRAVVELCKQADSLELTGVRSYSMVSVELLLHAIDKELNK